MSATNQQLKALIVAKKKERADLLSQLHAMGISEQDIPALLQDMGVTPVEPLLVPQKSVETPANTPAQAPAPASMALDSWADDSSDEEPEERETPAPAGAPTAPTSFAAMAAINRPPQELNDPRLRVVEMWRTVRPRKGKAKPEAKPEAKPSNPHKTFVVEAMLNNPAKLNSCNVGKVGLIVATTGNINNTLWHEENYVSIGKTLSLYWLNDDVLIVDGVIPSTPQINFEGYFKDGNILAKNVPLLDLSGCASDEELMRAIGTKGATLRDM